MSVLLAEFKTDLARIRRLVEALELLREFSGVGNAPQSEDAFTLHATSVQQAATNCHADIIVLCGSSILYIAGRFENFVRTVFEELCETVAKKCNSYDRLPKAMRSSLIALTAEVMKEPRKYGHADKGVESFIKTLAGNLSDKSKIESINYACLSITYENMRPETLDNLFLRIGASNIWDKLGQQASVQAFFETAEPSEAKNRLTKELNIFMDMRNKIAHPSSDVTWPDSSKVLKYLDVFDMMSEALVQISKVYEVSLPPRDPQAPIVASAHEPAANPSSSSEPSSSTNAVEPAAVVDP